MEGEVGANGRLVKQVFTEKHCRDNAKRKNKSVFST